MTIYIRIILYARAKYTLVLSVAACLCMTEEMGWQLSAIDNKKTVQVADFRLDDRPNQKPNKVWRHELRSVSWSETNIDLNVNMQTVDLSVSKHCQVQYKKSDMYLFEVLELICRAMSDFHVTVGG